jgi:hypothetical protein
MLAAAHAFRFHRIAGASDARRRGLCAKTAELNGRSGLHGTDDIDS